jgi:predicted alpha/beta-hydrolase family hydrolase
MAVTTFSSGSPSVTVRHSPAEGAAARATLVLAHGAGAGQDSPFMVDAARQIAARGIDAVTFNFPYMERHAKVPNPAPQLEACYREVVATLVGRGLLAGRRLFIGGKSMGGRMATHLAAGAGPLAHPLAGVVLLGYPLHPPGRPAQLRAAHLPAIRVPVLIVQGTRDTFGAPDEIAPAFAPLGSLVTLHAIDGGDHSFKVPGGRAAQGPVLTRIFDVVAAWIARAAGPQG